MLTFTDVTLDDVQSLRGTTSKDKMRKILSKCMKVDAEEGVAAEILLEFHLQNYLFCRSHPTLHNQEKTSTFLSLMRIIYEDAIGERKAIAKSFSQFKGMLDKHSKQTPPYSVGVFSPEEVGIMIDYASRTYFRHYKMYQYVYLKRRELDLRVQSDNLAPPVIQAYPLHRGEEVDPKEQPELAHFFAQPKQFSALVQPVEAFEPQGGYGYPPPPEAAEADSKLEAALEAFDASIKASDKKLDALMSN